MSQQEISIINLDQLVSMTSVEIAELTGKEHRNVLRDIRKMLEELN
ncbi:Rha family transcriptional regulator, partial [Shigella flexneri]